MNIYRAYKLQTNGCIEYDMNRFRHVLYPEIWHFKYTDRTNRLLNNHRYD